MLKRKPQWVPDWVWAEYLFFLKGEYRPQMPDQFASNPTVIAMEKRREWIADLIISSPGCELVWGALKRREKFHPPNHPKLGSDTPPAAHVRHAVRLLINADMASMGPQIVDLIPARERKKKGARIAALAAQLNAELKTLRNPANELPPHIDRAIVARGIDAAERLRRTRDFSEHREPSPPTENILSVELGKGIVRALVHETLAAIGVGAIEWGNSEPAIYRPKDPGAARLHFIIEMTACFRFHYGLPLREVTAALASSLYPGEMKAATVARLAP